MKFDTLKPFAQALRPMIAVFVSTALAYSIAYTEPPPGLWANITHDKFCTDYITQVAEQNKDTTIQNVEAMLADKDEHYVGKFTFSGGDDIFANLIDETKEQTAKWFDERILELTRFVILLVHGCL